ncbi:MAG: lysophospholipid acyltransferase family protein [Ilumatobacter sp.]|uniref:lysophospholipid acyltransferase family protein n=1 Tax=Ilumatobacter sp. TaxID=1967498 RepID=UPI0032983ABE
MSTSPGAGALQRRTRRVLNPAVTRLWDIEMTGYDRLPVDGPAILCPNHISFFDSAILTFTLPRNISFVGKAEYMDSWKTKYIFPAMGMIPIDRSGGAKSDAALDAARGVLERGELFGIYPEGTRSRNGNLHKGRTGAARLAMQIGCPIYPVGIVGTDQIQPPGARAPKLRKACAVHIGRPIKPERYANRGAEHMAWRSMMDEVMYEIREMTGQQYVHHYHGQEPDDVVASVEPTRIATVTDISTKSPVEGLERKLVAATGS